MNVNGVNAFSMLFTRSDVLTLTLALLARGGPGSVPSEDSGRREGPSRWRASADWTPTPASRTLPSCSLQWIAEAEANESRSAPVASLPGGPVLFVERLGPVARTQCPASSRWLAWCPSAKSELVQPRVSPTTSGVPHDSPQYVFRAPDDLDSRFSGSDEEFWTFTAVLFEMSLRSQVSSITMTGSSDVFFAFFGFEDDRSWPVGSTAPAWKSALSN